MRRPAIRSTAHDPILSYPTYQPPIQDVSLQISVPNCVPLRGYTISSSYPVPSSDICAQSKKPIKGIQHLQDPIMTSWQQMVDIIPDRRVHGANMGPIWGRQDPGGPHVGPMNLANWDNYEQISLKNKMVKTHCRWQCQELHNIFYEFSEDWHAFIQESAWSTFLNKSILIFSQIMKNIILCLIISWLALVNS